MHFNPEITLGTIIEAITIISALAAGLIRLGRLEQKVNIMYHWFDNAIAKGVIPNREDVKKFYGQRTDD